MGKTTWNIVPATQCFVYPGNVGAARGLTQVTGFLWQAQTVTSCYVGISDMGLPLASVGR